MKQVECGLCGDSGWIPGMLKGKLVSRRCDCLRQQAQSKNFVLAAIPERYLDATFDNFWTEGDAKVFEGARFEVAEWARRYPALDEKERSLLLHGGVGTGKTHLSVAALKDVLARGIAARFCDCAQLLRDIQQSYDPSAPASELEILGPMMDVGVLLLDDFAAPRPTEWVKDTLTLLINARYNAKRTTIFTTNYSLADLEVRLGARLPSRLQEMCRVVPMLGSDFRLRKWRAVEREPEARP